ncbi:MAG TPA: ATP-binding protein [Sandaracinaceae bacterium]
MRTAGETERARILEALPSAVFSERFRGGVASVLVEDGDRFLDGAVRIADPPEVWVRPLVPSDRVALDACLALLERRRAQVVHDTSGPAMGVLAALETVLEYEPIADSTRALLEDSRIGLLRLTRRLADRSDALTHPPEIVAGLLPALLSRLAQSCVDALDPQGHLRVDVSAPPVEVRLDASLVEGALATLLSNAWACRSSHELLARIEAGTEGDRIWVAVADDGRGLDDECLLRAGELGFAARPSGVGFGLFQLKRALARRAGALVVQAQPRGACVTVFIPSYRPDPGD